MRGLLLSTTIFDLGDSQGGGALLWGEPRFLRRGGNPPAPACPWGKRERGDQTPRCRRLFVRSAPVSTCQIFFSCCLPEARFIVASYCPYLNRRHALLPFALFEELPLRCQLVSSIW